MFVAVAAHEKGAAAHVGGLTKRRIVAMLALGFHRGDNAAPRSACESAAVTPAAP
jgi:hypothetical protein